MSNSNKQIKEKPNNRNKANPNCKFQEQANICQTHGNDDKYILRSCEKYTVFDLFRGGDIYRAICSIIIAWSLLFILNHFHTLPANQFWLIFDPVVLGVLGMFIVLSLCQEKYLLSSLLFIIQISFDLYPVFNSIISKHCNNLPILLSISVGIPPLMVFVGLISKPIWIFPFPVF